MGAVGFWPHASTWQPDALRNATLALALLCDHFHFIWVVAFIEESVFWVEGRKAPNEPLGGNLERVLEAKRGQVEPLQL